MTSSRAAVAETRGQPEDVAAVAAALNDFATAVFREVSGEKPGGRQRGASDLFVPSSNWGLLLAQQSEPVGVDFLVHKARSESTSWAPRRRVRPQAGR